jgi:hypothetical protein
MYEVKKWAENWAREKARGWTEKGIWREGLSNIVRAIETGLVVELCDHWDLKWKQAEQLAYEISQTLAKEMLEKMVPDK